MPFFTSLEPRVHIALVPNFDIRNPPKIVSVQVGELLYTNAPPMIPMMYVPLLWLSYQLLEFEGLSGMA